MIRGARLVLFAALGLFACLEVGRAPVAPAEPERWLVLGDSIAWDGRWVADLQTWLVRTRGREAPELLDCALPSETVSGLSEPEHLAHGFARPWLFERLDRVLDGVRPDFVLACYGMNDGLYQSLDEARSAAFRAGIGRLVAELERRGLAFVLLSPPPFDETRASLARDAHYDAVLESYSDWLVAQRSRGWSVVDMHAALAALCARERLRAPDFTFSPDGVHLDERGHRAFAATLAAALEPRASLPLRADPESIEATLATHDPAPARALVTLLRDAWLTHTGHTRPGLPAGLPLDRARREALELRAALLGE
jgi:lysophospholipase L1-like esterase